MEEAGVEGAATTARALARAPFKAFSCPLSTMSLISPRAALSSLLGSSNRANQSAPAPDSLIGSKPHATPDASASVRRKNAARSASKRSEAWSSEFFGSGKVSSWASKLRSEKKPSTDLEPPPVVTAFGVTGILESHIGLPPPELEVFGEAGILQSTRGHTPVGEHGRTKQAEATALADFFKQHADCELLPGGRVRCATTNTELPLSIHWLRKHWEGHKYRRAAEKLAAHALAVQVAAEEAEAWTMVDVENVDAVRMDRVFAAACAVTAEIEAREEAEAAEAARAERHAVPPETPPSSLLAEGSPCEASTMDRIFAAACAVTEAALDNGEAAAAGEGQALKALLKPDDRAPPPEPEAQSAAPGESPIAQSPAAPTPGLAEQAEAPLSSTSSVRTTRQTRSSRRPPPPPKGATERLDGARLVLGPTQDDEPPAPPTAAPPASPSKPEPATPTLVGAMPPAVPLSGARPAALAVPTTAEGVGPLGRATAGVTPSPDAAVMCQREWLQKELESCESGATTPLLPAPDAPDAPGGSLEASNAVPPPLVLPPALSEGATATASEVEAAEEQRADELRKRYTRMRVAELRAALLTLGLATDGTKPTLVARLVELAAAPAAATEEVAASDAPIDKDTVSAPEPPEPAEPPEATELEPAEAATAGAAAAPPTLGPETVRAMRVVELRAALAERGLSTEGYKPALTARLLQAEAARLMQAAAQAEAGTEGTSQAAAMQAPEAPEPEPDITASKRPQRSARSAMPIRSTRSTAR